MKKLLLLLVTPPLMSLVGVWAVEQVTFGAYAAKVEQMGVTHAGLVESASFGELFLAAQPWALAIFMVMQWCLYTPQQRLWRNLGRWLALMSPLMVITALFAHEDILRSLLHLGGPFNFPHAPAFAVCIAFPIAVGTLIPVLLISRFRPNPPKTPTYRKI